MWFSCMESKCAMQMDIDIDMTSDYELCEADLDMQMNFLNAAP